MKGRARNADPQTSKEAGDFDASFLITEVYKAMEVFGDSGCISSEIEAMFPELAQHTITPRFAQMVELGMIEVTGERRAGVSGRSQMVRRVLPPPFIKQPKINSELVELRARVKLLEEVNAELLKTLTLYWWGE